MNEKRWYEVLFENYAEKYDKEVFTRGTIDECDFIEKELNYDKSLKILDVGCGTGRHSIELSKRGYLVTGIDLSESQLKKAIEKAKTKNLSIPFIKCDARNLPFNEEFDIAIMLCEGGFPLMETDEENYEILKNVTKSLKIKSKFIFTTLNALYPLFHPVDEFINSQKESNYPIIQNSTFDIMTLRDYTTMIIEDDSGNIKKIECNERFYMPSEIRWLLKTLGYNIIDIYGAKLGAFSRNDKLTKDDYEMLVIAEK